MKTSLWIVGLIIGLGLLIISGFIYFASQISAVYPPIKEYKFPTSASNLKLEIIRTLDNQKEFEYKFTDTLGNEQVGFAYYIDLRIKDLQMDNEYTFKYYDNLGHLDNSKIDLIGAFDKIRKTGGYKTKDADVPRLINIFDKEFINKLEIRKTKK